MKSTASLNHVVEARGLEHSYGSRRGIADVSFDLSAGKIYGFLGPNGAGKTTTIRILLGFLRASRGSGSVFGLDCWRDSRKIKQQVGYVAGDVRLYPWMTARSGLRMVQAIRSVPLVDHGLELCDLLRLDPALTVRKMSRGTRQKTALVLALAHRPKLLVLDEPTSGLDPVIQLSLMSYLRNCSKLGQTVLFSSHTLSEVEDLCDQVMMLRHGRMVVNQPLSELKLKAPRTVRLELHGLDSRLENLPASLQLIDRSKQVVNLRLQGDSMELIRWASAPPITDVSIGAPSLELLFRQYYGVDSLAEVESDQV
jgi:ABC-2 type transport system ATP-binding protein